MGGDAQPQIHAQVVSALVDGGVDVATAVAAPRWFVGAGASTSRRRSTSALEPRYRAGVVEALAGAGPPASTRRGRSTAASGHEHAIELVDGGPAASDGSLAAATDPRSAGLPAVW